MRPLSFKKNFVLKAVSKTMMRQSATIGGIKLLTSEPMVDP